MWWFDTSNSLLKQRNADDDAWVTVASKVDETWVPYSEGNALTVGEEVGDVVRLEDAGDTAATPTLPAVDARNLVNLPNSGVWEEIADGTLTNAGALPITFSGYRTVKIFLSDFLPVTDGAILGARTSTDAGANYDLGASDYGWARTTFNTAPTFIDSAGDGADAEIEFGNPQGNQAAEVAAYEVTIHDPATAKPTIIKFEGASHNTAGSFQELKASGVRLASADVNGIQFAYSTNNIASGRYRAIGLVE